MAIVAIIQLSLFTIKHAATAVFSLIKCLMQRLCCPCIYMYHGCEWGPTKDTLDWDSHWRRSGWEIQVGQSLAAGRCYC